MSILTMEKWKAIPGQWGWQVSSKGQVKHNGRLVKAPEGSIELGSESVLVADLVRMVFSGAVRNSGRFRRMFLLKKGWYRPPGVITAGGFKPGP